MGILTQILEFVKIYLQTAPVNFTILVIVGLIAVKVLGWTVKRFVRVIVFYILLTILGQLFGFRVPTYYEVFDYVKTIVLYLYSQIVG